MSLLGERACTGVYWGGDLLLYFRVMFIILGITFSDCFNVLMLVSLHFKNFCYGIEFSNVAARMMVF